MESVHASGELHKAITDNLDEYLTSGPEISKLLERLVSQNKKLFLISNSGFPFMYVEMCKLLVVQSMCN